MAITLKEVTVQSGARKLMLTSPYDPDLPTRAKAIGGQFSGAQKAWFFDPRDAERVRALCLDIYGVDPLAATPPDLVTVRIQASLLRDEQSWWLLGRELARRSARDAAVRLGEGVILVSGGFAGSGGSAKNPRLAPRDGTVLEVRDVPKVLVEQLWAEGWNREELALVEEAVLPAPVDPLAQLRETIAVLPLEQRTALREWLCAADVTEVGQ